LNHGITLQAKPGSHKHTLSVYCLKVKGLNIYIPPLTGKPKQQWFIIQSGVLTSIAAGSAAQSPERTDLGPAVCSSTDSSMPHYGLHYAMFSSSDWLF